MAISVFRGRHFLFTFPRGGSAKGGGRTAEISEGREAGGEVSFFRLSLARDGIFFFA